MIPMYHKVVLHWSSEASSAPPWSSTLLPTWLVLLSVGSCPLVGPCEISTEQKKGLRSTGSVFGRWQRGRDDPGFLSWFFHWWCWHPVIYRSQLRKSNKTRKLGSWDHVGITMVWSGINPTTVSEFLTLVGLGPALGSPFSSKFNCLPPSFPLMKAPKYRLVVEGPK